jgi:hypothetical protein
VTDRVNMLMVALEHDIREDDVQGLVNAIKQLRGVLTVDMNVANSSDWLAEVRVKAKLQAKLFEVLDKP